MRKLRENKHNSRMAHASCPYFTLNHLSPLARVGFVVQVDTGNKSSCRSAYRLTRKGREFVKWH